MFTFCFLSYPTFMLLIPTFYYTYTKCMQNKWSYHRFFTKCCKSQGRREEDARKTVKEYRTPYSCFDEKLVKIYEGIFNNKAIKIIVFIISIIWIIVCIVLGAFTKETNRASIERFFVEDHHLNKDWTKMNNDFGMGTPYDMQLPIYITWGIKGVDRGKADRYDYNDYGKPDWDDDFDLSGYLAQLAMIEICTSLRVTI